LNVFDLNVKFEDMPSGEDREPEYDALLEMLRRAMFLFMPDFA